MKKVMLLVAMLAMVLAAAAPALAQSVQTGDTAAGGGDQVNQGDETVFNAVCQNIIGSFSATTGQYGAGDVGIAAVGGNDAAVVADVAREQNVSVTQVNNCLNAAGAIAPGTATATATAAAAAQYQYAAPTAAAPTATVTALPPTGGAVPFSGALALGAGALLVAGGLLARRIVR